MSEDTTLEKHAAFRTNFPEGCHERAAIIQSLTASYNRSCTTMKRTCTAQERATKKRLFTDSETVKDCMLAVVDEVLTDDKVKTSVTSAIKQVPLSDTSDIRRVDVVATDVMAHVPGGMSGPHHSAGHGPPPVMLHYAPPQQGGSNPQHGPPPQQGAPQHFYIGHPQAVQVQAHPTQQLSFHPSAN